jgi:hypothetical protein|tara:strand:- start:1207 stop:1509 length:303 start_codon:yes stop_codon:yes gene_type:complete
MAKKERKAIQVVMFNNTSTHDLSPKFNQKIEVERDYVTDLDISPSEITRLVAEMEKTGKFVLPAGLELEGGFWPSTSNKGNAYYSGNLENPYKKKEEKAA